MDVGLLKTLGEVLGIGGVALGVFFLLFRELIRKSIFPKLKEDDAYRLLQLITVLVWSVAVIGVAAWLWGDHKGQASAVTTSGPRAVTTSGPQSPVVQDTKGDVRIDFNAPQADPR